MLKIALLFYGIFLHELLGDSVESLSTTDSYQIMRERDQGVSYLILFGLATYLWDVGV